MIRALIIFTIGLVTGYTLGTTTPTEWATRSLHTREKLLTIVNWFQ